MSDLSSAKSIWFFFSDPAGAKACLAQGVRHRLAFPKTKLRFFSNRSFDFETSWPFQIEKIQGLDVLFHEELPEFLFMGTSHPDSSKRFELRALEKAKHLGIRSIGFIDHFTNLKLRFALSNGEFLYPDEIWVMDQQTKQMASDEGIPAKLLEIHESPYLLFLKENWKPKFTRAEFFEEFGLGDTRKKIVVYAPDPVSLRPNQDIEFDEASATDDVLDVFQDLSDTVSVLVKLHPLQPKSKMAASLSKHQGLAREIELNDNAELIAHADLVIGFYSNFLLEALALGKSVVRYFPGNRAFDPFTGKKIGVVAYTRDEFMKTVRNQI